MTWGQCTGSSFILPASLTLTLHCVQWNHFTHLDWVPKSSKASYSMLYAAILRNTAIDVVVVLQSKPCEVCWRICRCQLPWINKDKDSSPIYNGSEFVEKSPPLTASVNQPTKTMAKSFPCEYGVWQSWLKTCQISRNTELRRVLKPLKDLWRSVSHARDSWANVRYCD